MSDLREDLKELHGIIMQNWLEINVQSATQEKPIDMSEADLRQQMNYWMAFMLLCQHYDLDSVVANAASYMKELQAEFSRRGLK